MARLLRVLIVEDSEDDALLLTRHLRGAGFDPTTLRVDTIEALQSALTARRWDVILCDVMMPLLDAFDALKVVAAAAIDAPFIVVSGAVGEDKLVELMQAGADDVILKDALTRLVPAIDRGLIQASERRDRRDSEERFRVAFDTAPHGIALVDLTGRWLKANRAVTEMLGYTEEELSALDFQAITHPDDLARDLDLVNQVLDGEIPNYQMEKRYIRKDGESVPALLSVSLVRDGDGAPRYFVSQLLDLTARKEMEAQLLQAQKLDAVGQLTGGVAHDFNNLLTVILGNARLMQRRLDADAEAASSIDAIIGAAQRGADLTRRLLAFSRKEAMEPKVVDCCALIAGMIDMMGRTLGDAIEIETELSGGPLHVLVDPGQLEAALLNLATNARDAMVDRGTLTIAVTAGSDSVTNADSVIISVSDTGCGITAEHRDKVFEPFFTTKEIGKGTGLGLSMVFGFAEQSGGRVEIDSIVGEGTRISLVLRKVPVPASAQPAATAAAAPGAGSRGSILVVEDQPEVRAVAVSVLEDLGYRVTEAEDGPTALRMLETQPDVDLLFTDMIMSGGMTGHELATRARRGRPDLKVLYTSGFTDDALDSVPPDARTVAMLPKPYEDTALVQRVREVLESS